LKGVIPEGYTAHVPKGAGNQLVAGLQLIPPEHRNAWRMHRVASGETLASIGKAYGMASSSIVAVNKLAGVEAEAGDRLIIPAGLRVDAPARRVGTHAAPAAHRRAAIRHSAAATAPPQVSGAAGRSSALLARTAAP